MTALLSNRLARPPRTTSPSTRRSLVLQLEAFGGVLVIVMILSFILGPSDRAVSVVGAPLEVPGAEHWFGLDSFGMDVFSRVMAATRLDIGVALASGAVVFVTAYPVALALGFWNTVWTKVVLRLLDIFQSLPAIVLALTVVALTGNSIPNLVFVSAFVFAPAFVRTVRSIVLTVREQTFVEAAISTGVPPWRVLLRHVLPHTLGAALAQATIAISRTIILIAGLSFIGVGVQTPTPEWGSMLQTGLAPTLNGAWWVALYPGVAIVLTVLLFDRLGTLLVNLTSGAKR